MEDSFEYPGQKLIRQFLQLLCTYKKALYINSFYDFYKLVLVPWSLGYLL